MSTTTLNPLVARKLRQFGRRRFLLILARGLCAAVVTFVLCMAVVAFVDWGWVLSDRTRWLLSGGAYLLTIGVAWMTCVSKIVRSPAQEEIASQVEGAEPELRENLVSAVELATDDPAAVHDSPVFRSLLQGKVADQMSTLRVPRLLPLRLLARWLMSAAAVVAVLALLLTGSDPRFRTLAARAMLPGANIERVSRIHVEILQPTPSSLMIAKDETVAVVVNVSGGNVDEVTLETFTPGQPNRLQSMRARTESEFAANIHVSADAIEYRILAGDAVTKRHLISGKDRPRVVAFQKTFRYPAYSGLSEKTVTEDHGDVVVLEGTEAHLQLELDQEVSTAEIRIDVANSDDVNTIALTKNDVGVWCTDVPVEEAAIYKVHLVSRETGFANIFSPRYEIRPVPDLIPRAGFVDQAETNLLLPPNDILALKGMGEDDLPLQDLQQEISVNGMEWVVVPLEAVPVESKDEQTNQNSARETANARHTNEGTFRIAADWSWDLLGLELKTGDQVTTRLVATDLKGNRGESVPIRIVVSAPDFDPQRHAVMEKKLSLLPAISRLARIAEEHKKIADEIVKQFRQDLNPKKDAVRSAEEQALDRTTLAALPAKLREEASALLKEVHEVTRAMPAGADAYELDLAGRLVSRLIRERSHLAVHALDVLESSDDAKLRKAAVEELNRGFVACADDAKSLHHHYQYLSTHNVLNALASDFDALLRQQKLVVDSPTQTWTRLLRQETVVINQMLVAERLLHDYRDEVSQHLQSKLTQLLDWSIQRREMLEQATESEDKLKDLQRLAQQLHRELGDRQRIDVMDGGLPERLKQARRDFDARSGLLTEPLSLMSTYANHENRLAAAAAEADDSNKAEELLQEAKQNARQVDLKIRPSMEQFRDRRSLNQSRADNDAQFAADAGLTHRAVTSLMNQFRQGDPKESIVPTAFQEIAPAYRVLEAGHDVANTMLGLENLIQLERWGSQDLPARSEHPRQWDAVYKGLEQSIAKLRGARIDNKIIGKFDQLRWAPSTGEVNRKLGQRRWSRDRMISASGDLVGLRDEMLPVTEELKPAMAEARAIIAKYAPTIPEMAQQIALQVRDLEQQTTDAADALEQDTKTPESQSDQSTESASDQKMAQLQEQQEQINQQLDDLFEALVEDANAQDLVDSEQRKRARDADDSIAMIQEPARQMNQELQQAAEANDAQKQAQELSQAAEQQERTAQALDRVGEHFEKLESGEDVAESRAELREFERETGIARQVDQQFEEARDLAEMAEQKPQDLLAELEAELQRNPAMQQALSEISRNTVEEARNALEDAAKQEQEIQRANERSDADTREKKKQLTKELRDIGQEAADLSRKLVAQAESAAAQSKTPEAQKKFQETRRQLNEAASAANKSDENQLLADLAENARQAQQALQEASKALDEGEQKSAAAKEQEIHADEKNRQNAKKNLENQRKRFMDQQKREADAVVRRRDGEERNAAAQVRNAQNNLKNYDRQVQQAKKNLNKKPDDASLKARVAQAEARKEQAQQKVDAAQQKHEEAKKIKADARKERNALNSVPQPPLDDKNPAAQLAEDFAKKATENAAELNRRAEELAKQIDFGDQLKPTESQLANATTQQQKINDEVQGTSENLARAARHERRLQQALAGEALQQASDRVQEVANNEATQAVEKLQAAEDAASPAEAPDGEEKSSSQPALDANAAVAQSEQAIAEAAESLTPIVDAAKAAAAAAQAGEPSNQPATPQNAPQTERPQQAQNGTGQPAEAQTPSGQNGEAQPSDSGNAPQSFTPEQMAQGQQLARALDELDRQQSAATEQGQTPSQQSRPLPSIAQAARNQQAQIASARSQAQQEAALAQESEGFNDQGIPASEGETGEFALLSVNRSEDSEWGKLRDKAANDLTQGKREVVSEEYRKSVEAYFKVLAERARRKK